MPELDIVIVWANKQRGNQHESLCNIESNGSLLFGGMLINSQTELTDEEIKLRVEAQYAMMNTAIEDEYEG